MDDLYNNAWGDSSEYPASSATWSTTPVVSPAQHEEADLANPSWSTGNEVKWDQPSEHASEFGWSTADADAGWGPSTYEGISIEKPETDSGPTDENIPTTPTTEDTTVEDTDEDRSTESPVTEDAAPVGLGFSVPVSIESESLAVIPDPDGFGTFEDATSVSELHSKLAPDVEEDSWGSPWASAPAEDEDEPEAKRVDEWELARKNKEQLDRKVPPELLASILSQCEEYFRETIKPADSKKSESKEEPWMADWRGGIEGIEGLEASMQTLVPELTLQPAAQFTKTAIVKNVAGCIRVTKNLPLSKASPMSHYLAAKGSTAWEAAVKQRKGGGEDDVVPVGWRIVENQNTGTLEHQSPTVPKSGGLFSFWSKRQSKPPAPVATTPKESSPTRPSTPSQSNPLSRDSDSQPVRASVDTTPSPSLSSATDRQPSPAPETIPRKDSLDIFGSPSSTPPTTYADAPEPEVDLQAQPLQPPPSAVSRFLNRFSRKRSSIGSASPRSSLALSTDDLEFLSDIIPSASDNHDDDDDQLKNLHDMLKPEPLPPALPPPPLAPPPRPTPTAGSSSQRPNATSAGQPSVFGSTDSLPPPSQGQTPQSDLDDLFGAFETSPSPTSASGTAAISAASVPAVASIGRAPARSPSPLIPATQSRTSSPSPLSFSNTLVPTRTESLPGVLPPPSTPPLPRSSTNPSESSMSRRPSLKPKVPLSFTIPAPPAEISPTLPSASEIPLAQLYPQAAARQQAQQSSPGSSPQRASLPAQPSRSHTPVMVKAPLNSKTTSAPLLPPPPGSSQVSASAATNLFGDDDDFDDFQSSTPVMDNTSTSFAFPPPPSATTKLASLAPLLPPPSNFASPIRPSPSTPQPLSSDPLSDDFGALLSSSASLDSHRSRKSGMNSTFQSDQSLLSTPQKSRAFHFDEVSPVSTALRTPSPPRPPSKPAKLSLALDPPQIPAPPSILSPEEKQARVNQHMRTLSLMERAAARPGQWPAPPSPLPQALSFGVLGEKAKNAVDLLGDDESFGAFESEGIAALPSAGPGKLGSIVEAKETKAPPAWGGIAPPSAKPLPSASTGKKGAGGLSAQDLSFFEGL
ncbi:hypothetical protein PsYK624_071850 [Phanerochaete sordida]|uniref:Uncharacterized protein n=1 Tax=Phanerochaete sordida TaxID=48140 RepID=A0A9P3GAG9_9APHY|nr:hypothetical protein PsYK624_071850 [Phanerochaete sordida]